MLVLKFAHERAFHVEVLASFAEKLRCLLCRSVTRPRRAVELCGGHSLRRHNWKKLIAAKSRPAVASFCIHENGRQPSVALLMFRCTSESCVTCMMSPDAHWSWSCNGVPSLCVGV